MSPSFHPLAMKYLISSLARSGQKRGLIFNVPSQSWTFIEL
jgi:hypothetical protein